MSNSEQAICGLQGEPYVRIRFLVRNEHGAACEYEMDCNVQSAHIRGLKYDFANLFRIPEDRQDWKLGDKLLNDDDILLKYITLDSDGEWTITVTWKPSIA